MGKILKGKEQLTLGYGKQTLNGKTYNHKGIDIVKFKYQLDYITAIEEGIVIKIKNDTKGFVSGSYGNYVWIRHENGYTSFYAHLKHNSIRVKEGQKVKKGQIIAYMGATGMAYGAHLHFEMEKNGKLIDPTPFVFGTAEIKPKQTKKTINQIAKEVIDGKWGNGADRKKRLTNAGYNYNVVQNEVNKILLGTKPISKKSVEQIAREVIQGKWGNGVDRKRRLIAAGYSYNEVQKKVNQLLK